jgi:hypothetical protein
MPSSPLHKGLPMAKKTIKAKEILADIKAGMKNHALMEKYWLSEKGLQNSLQKACDL